MSSQRPAFGQQKDAGEQRRPSFGGGQKRTARAAFGGGQKQSAARAAFGGGQKQVARGATQTKKTSKATSRWKTGGLKAANLGYSKRAENSNDPKVLRGAGMTSFKTNKFDEARKHLQKIIDMSDDDWQTKGLKRDDIVDAKLLRALALSHYEVAKKNAAIIEYDHDANYSNFEAAQKVFSPALRHMENAADPNLLLQAGKCYEGLADWQGALTIYGSIIAGFPRYEKMTTVILRAVAVLAQTGQMPTAAAYCERILDLPPPGIKQDDMMFILARVYELAGRQAEAQDTFKEVHRLYNKRQVLLKQRLHQKNNESGNNDYSHHDDEELKNWADQDNEGPALDCVNYGDFRSWRKWYEHPETWRRRMARFASVLDLPIFAADANVEILRREQQAGKATPQTWLSLSRIKHRLRDPAVSLQAALKALELDRYNDEIRAYVAKKDPDGWAEAFQLEEKRATDIQRVLYHGRKGRWMAFRKKHEHEMMHNSATLVQKVRRGQLGKRKAAFRKREVNSSIVVQSAFRRKMAKKQVQFMRDRKVAAKMIQRRARINFKLRRAATEIQKIIRGALGKKRANLQRKRIQGATKMQGLFRSYKWRKIAREIRTARDAAVNIERVFRGSVARTYFRYIHSRFVGARGVQRVGRGWRVRRRVRNLKSMSATLIQKLIRGHFGRMRVGNLRSAVRHHMLHTPVVQLMRAASIEANCSWLSRHALSDIHYLNDAFASESVVSETNTLTKKDAKRIGAMLYKNNMVKTLILSSGEMGDEGAAAVASALQHNKSLRTLALGPNNIGVNGAHALAATLKNHNYSLRHLCLDFNPLGSIGSNVLLGAVGDFFCRNYGQLQRLTLSACGVDDACASALGDLLYMNRRLMYIDLSGNKIADVAVKELSQALRNNSTLIGLDLRGNMIRSEGAILLAACLRQGGFGEATGECNKTLQSLRVDCNIILDSGALALLQVFEDSTSLRSLTIDGNPLGRRTTERFVEVSASRENRKNRHDDSSDEDVDKGKLYSISSSSSSPHHHSKSLPILKIRTPKPHVPTELSDGSPLPYPPRGRAAFQEREISATKRSHKSPLSLDSVVPPEMRRSYISLDRDDGYDTLSLSRPLRPVFDVPVTHPSPSVPKRLYRRRRSPVRIAPRHTAKPMPNVFLAMVAPPAMHVNPIHSVDESLLRKNRRHLLSRSQIKSQPRNKYGGPRW